MEEDSNIALIESWDNTQAMMEADFELAQRLQAEEQGEITIEERSRLFVELMNKKRKHFAKLRAKEKRRKPPTKLIKEKSNDELESDKSKKAESSEKKAEGSRKKSIGKKRAGKSKNKINYQKTNIEWMMKRRQIHEEAEEMEEAGMKKHIEDFKMIGNIH
ncbi:hypothetical protein Tco_0228403 [Tanacetum coccineum]